MAGPKSVRFTPEDFKDAPVELRKAFEKLFQSLNPFLSETAGALDRRLTVTGNLVSEVRTVTVTAPDWVSVATSGTTDPYFKNSWTNFGPTRQGARVWQDDQGFVHIQGGIKDGTISATAFTLPEHLRPALNTNFPGTATSGGGIVAGQIDVNANGNVVPLVTANLFVPLNHIRYYAGPPRAFSGAGWPINLTPSFQVLDCRLIQATDTSNPTTSSHGAGGGMDWKPAPKGIVIRRVAGLSPGRTYQLKFLLLGQ